MGFLHSVSFRLMLCLITAIKAEQGVSAHSSEHFVLYADLHSS